MATSNEGKEPYLAGGNKGWRSIFREDGRRGRVIRSSFVTHGSRMEDVSRPQKGNLPVRRFTRRQPRGEHNEQNAKRLL